MSPQVIGDPAEIRRFAAALRQLATEIEQATKKIDHNCKQLGDTWRDQEYDKFAAEWNSTSPALFRFFNEIAPNYVLHLNIKARKMEEYLNEGRI